jgi:hypothetical protein
MFRIDFIFSYWLFAWYLLYMARMTIYSPKFGLMIALIEAVISFALLKTANSFTMFSTIIIVSCIKILPLITLWREPIRQRDIWVLFVWFVIYNVWLGVHGETMPSVYKKIQVLLDKNTDELPFMYVLSKIFGKT